MKWRSPWAEQLSVPMVAFCTAFALHVAAAHFSHSLLTTADGTVVLCLATGTSVGIALVANGARARWAALIGGVIGEAVFLATVQLPYGNVAEFASHITEASIAFCSLYLLTTSRFSSSLGPTRSIAAMTFCISAATLGALPAALPDQSARFILDWGLGHGIGIFAMTSAIVAFVLREPRALPQHASRRTSLVGALLAIAVIVLLAVFVETSFILILVGCCLFFTSQFGREAGQPNAILVISVIVISATQGIGELATQPFNIIGLFSFAGAVSLLSSMVGRLALHTDRRVLEEQKAADRWQKLASTGFDGFIEVDANTHISDASESVALFLGVSADEMRGVPFRSIFDEAGWSNVSHFVRLALAGQSVRFDRSFTTATGQTEWALTLVEPRLDDSGKFAGCTIFFLNTTATHQIRAERAQARAALVVAQETERRRLAQLVHDGALQDLAAANLLIGAALFAANDNATEPGSPAENLERIESLLVSGMRKLRADAIGSPVIDLRDIGVLDALEQTISKFESVATAEVTISERGIDQAQAELSRLIFQIAQEALVNALVHSKATEIHIDLRRTRDGFSIAVTDDGIGFDNSRLQEVGHMGLSAMAALAHEAGGWCSLSTRPGRGTAVEAWLPDSETSRLGTAIQMR